MRLLGPVYYYSNRMHSQCTLANLNQNHFISELVKITEKFEFVVKGDTLGKFLKALKVASNISIKIGIHQKKLSTKSISQINHFTRRGQAFM